jgi:uncharacterized membrane protein
MMLLWIPLMLVVPFVILLAARSWAGIGCCGIGQTALVPRSSPSGDDPMGIVRQRLARGEISLAEFEEIQRLLG